MRRVMVSVLGVLLLVSACGSSGGGSDEDNGEGGKKVSYESVKSSVDDLTAKILPALASGLDGEFPLVRGKFTECGVGPNNQKYSVRGELHSQVDDNAEAAESIRAVLTDAGLDVEITDDQTVKGTIDGTDVVVLSSSGRSVGGVMIRSFSLDSECQWYSEGDAEAMREIAPNEYGSPVTGAS
ncbi:hypothetical protein GEV27_12650 [Aeromicrobium sp. S22]|uniref:hypothetical protein n=1 Tax=Aeromicrobium sp. S22 TaxID=2662029 RepID=UPI00129DAE6B|nr:hypothetical protein [Aeromicrobium sp. S22]MRK02368.1 hypothetical protein [Aeromicrobium sp. S22]